MEQKRLIWLITRNSEDAISSPAIVVQLDERNLNGSSSSDTIEELPDTIEHSRVVVTPPEMVDTATETIRLSSAETGDRVEGATSSS
jgi:hypothetical protein